MMYTPFVDMKRDEETWSYTAGTGNNTFSGTLFTPDRECFFVVREHTATRGGPLVAYSFALSADVLLVDGTPSVLTTDIYAIGDISDSIYYDQTIIPRDAVYRLPAGRPVYYDGVISGSGSGTMSFSMKYEIIYMDNA